ncbi:SUKH-3 domain-containing protein [Streptomyces sp. NPDC087228]
MSGETERPEREALKALLAGVERVEFGEVDVEAACAAYTEAGYEVTGTLREFLENYGEIAVGWTAPDTGEELVLAISVEEAMEVYPPNVRSYSRRLGMQAVPIGIAMETEENVLLVENGDIVFAGDAGMQRVGNGFEAAVKAFVSSTWDKTFF